MENSFIRLADIEDYPAYYRLSKENYLFHQGLKPDHFKKEYSFTKEKMEKMLLDPSMILVVYVQQTILGYASIEIKEKKSGKCYYIHEIGVDEKHRNNNIGSQLYNYIRQAAIEDHAISIELSVFKENSQAISFYKKQGMENTKLIMEERLEE